MSQIESASSRIPLGIVVVCGIMFSLILTLFVIPAMYSYISGKRRTNDENEGDTQVATNTPPQNDQH